MTRFGSRRAGVVPRAGLVFTMALLAIVMLTGCGARDGAAEGPVRYATYPDGAALGEGDGALLAGALTTRGGCLVVELADGSVVVPVLPASETTWDPDAERITIGSTGHRVGDTVSFGGGYADTASDIDLPEACADLGEHFLVSAV